MRVVRGMGEVYRADDLKLGQPVALKLLPESVDRDPARLPQLHTEVRMAPQVSHPNVSLTTDVSSWRAPAGLVSIGAVLLLGLAGCDFAARPAQAAERRA